jgi:hypothetical protein
MRQNAHLRERKPGMLPQEEFIPEFFAGGDALGPDHPH